MKLTKKQRTEIESLLKGTDIKLAGNRIEWKDRWGRMVLPLTSNPVGLVRLALKVTSPGVILDDYDGGKLVGFAEALGIMGGERE